jgi:CRISPR-associated endonuclease Cas2
MDIVITYDIATTKRSGQVRLRRVADICTAYGHRVQKSVFECRISPTQVARLIGALEDVIDSHQDTVSIYRINGDLNECRTVLGLDEQSQRLGSPWLV